MNESHMNVYLCVIPKNLAHSRGIMKLTRLWSISDPQSFGVHWGLLQTLRELNAVFYDSKLLPFKFTKQLLKKNPQSGTGHAMTYDNILPQKHVNKSSATKRLSLFSQVFV